MHRKKRDYRPLHWSNYFDRYVDVRTDETNTFRVYLSNFESGKSKEIILPKTVIVLLHGGGYSGLTWSLFTKEMQENYHDCGLLAIDLRGHGCTVTSDDYNLCMDRMVCDVEQVIEGFYQQVSPVKESDLNSTLGDDTSIDCSLPNIVLVGHSMGGAIAVKCAAKSSETFFPNLVGIVVIDVVEGTAIDALQGMQSVLRARPKHFVTLENAIEWSVRSGMTRNGEASRVSMPGNLVNIATQKLAIFDVSDELKSTREKVDTNLEKRIFCAGSQLEKISQYSHSDDDSHHITRVIRTVPLPRLSSSDTAPDPTPPTTPDEATVMEHQQFSTGYVWRTDLMKTQKFWTGWFKGLSNDLLAAPVRAKLLLLAGIDRLDKDLTIGQMQGKFMMRVLPKCGHAVHEDVPEQVCEVIGTFLVRNKLIKRRENATENNS